MNHKIYKIIGWILLTPPLFSVFLFAIWIFFPDINYGGESISTIWLGTSHKVTQLNIDVDSNFQAVALDSMAPIYFGLMAIAGAYMISNSEKKN